MAHFWQSLRSGGWLTPARVCGYSLLLLGMTLAGLLAWVALSDHGIDRNGKPLGTDFSNVYAAGVLTLSGQAADAYDPPRQYAAERAVFGGREVPFFGWHYPPFFFVVAALVATMPYAWGLALWLATSGLAYLATIRAILPNRSIAFDIGLAALAFPAVLVNIGHGQNGFMTAALLGAGLHLLDRRPALAGLLIGLLAYKPQFGVLIPLVLLVSGRWTTIAAAAATVGALIAMTFAVFGAGVWQAFFASMTFTQQVVLEQGGTGWEKIQSIFSATRMWGASLPVAYAVQSALALALAASLAWLWRSDAGRELKASALATACLLATPYVLDYDLVVLAVSIAFFVRHGLTHGFRDYEISLLAAVWTVPLITRSVAGVTGIPLGLIVVMALYVLTLRRAVTDIGGVSIFNHRLARV
ncbi:glycosyltransferase family 87 protein [Bradyrhizobium prioriisuperbiae]|uniref:glycosyltransferase family 87 protein n=1 Tax=Bradyrhizobium prioriisuperbiae TaxID=2854389 RepID=UPI0028EF9485|nr:glycosyltransferase family 87 protein [Bradyrhizobium prioritasuperba]